MKKVIFLFLLAIVLNAGAAYSQPSYSFERKIQGVWQAYLSGSEITYSIRYDSLLDDTLAIKNIGSGVKHLNVKKIYLKRAQSCHAGFCWDGRCYTSDEPRSQNVFAINGGQTLYDKWTVSYFGMGKTDESILRYTIWSNENQADSSWLIIHFLTSKTDVEEIQGEFRLTVSPNPCAGSTVFSSSEAFQNNVKIFISDLHGKILKELSVMPGQTKTYVNLDGLPSGIYLYQLKGEHSHYSSGKLIIQK